MEVNFCATKSYSSILDTLYTMQRNDQLCDIQFMVEGEQISAHKIILAIHSDYFKNMFTGKFKDSKLLEIKHIEITPNSLKLLIQFIYTSQLTINESNVEELLIASNFLLLNTAMNECLKFMKQTININNFITYRDISVMHEIDNLYELFVSFVLKNYNEVVKLNIYLSFSFELMKTLIESDDLCAEEEQVYESIMVWLKHDIESRSTYLPELLKVVRLNLLTIEYLDQNLQEEDLIKSNLKCINYLCEVYKEKHIKPTGKTAISLNWNYKPRKFTKVIITSNEKYFVKRIEGNVYF